jgi:hypothetical protein
VLTRTLWLAVSALVAGACLLLAFDRVVRQGVQRGADRRSAEAAQATALWRCNAEKGLQARIDCRMTFPSNGYAARDVAP